MTLGQQFFSFHGRLRRRDFWSCWILLILVAGCALAAAVLGFGVEGDDPRLNFLGLVTAWPAYAVLVKRMHDRDRTGWLALLLFGTEMLQSLSLLLKLSSTVMLPVNAINLVVMIWFLIEFGMLEGLPGENRYGPSPKANDLNARPTDKPSEIGALPASPPNA